MIRSGQHLALPGGWHIEPIGEWCAGLAGQVEEIVKQVVAAIEGADDRTRPGFPAGRRYRQLRNLVHLGRFDLAGLSNTDRMRVFKANAADLDRPLYRIMARRVARMLTRSRRKDAG
jgi:hypothetical protein